MTTTQYTELKSLLEKNIKETKAICEEQGKMKVFLLGQDEYDQHGLIHRMEGIETHIKKHKKRQMKAEGIRATVALMIGFTGSHIKELWHSFIDLLTN